MPSLVGISRVPLDAFNSERQMPMSIPQPKRMSWIVPKFGIFLKKIYIHPPYPFLENPSPLIRG